MKRPILKSLAVAAALSLATLGAAQAATFKLSHVRPQGTAIDKDANWYAQEVAKATNGKLEIKVYAAGDQVLVDVMQSNPGGETRVFRQLRETVLYELDQRFGSRVYVTPATKLMREKPRKTQ